MTKTRRHPTMNLAQLAMAAAYAAELSGRVPLPALPEGFDMEALREAITARPPAGELTAIDGVVCGRGRNPTLSRGHAFRSS